jgi:hypothetical protein
MGPVFIFTQGAFIEKYYKDASLISFNAFNSVTIQLWDAFNYMQLRFKREL